MPAQKCGLPFLLQHHLAAGLACTKVVSMSTCAQIYMCDVMAYNAALLGNFRHAAVHNAASSQKVAFRWPLMEMQLVYMGTESLILLAPVSCRHDLTFEAVAMHL